MADAPDNHPGKMGINQAAGRTHRHVLAVRRRGHHQTGAPTMSTIDPTAWIADTATVLGDVTLGPETGIWFGAVVRTGAAPITIGARTNIQDGCILHTDPGFPIDIGDDVSVGHRAVLHGCRIGDGSLIGMGAIIMNGARIGRRCLVAAGTLVPEGMVVEDGTLVMGAPARPRRPVTDAEADAAVTNAHTYVMSRPTT